MSSLADKDPTGRFSELAAVYAKSRPDYPEEALDYVIGRCGLGPGSLVVDVGSGTGISSRLFVRRSIPVLGIEPNEAMREQAGAVEVPGAGQPEYRGGRAEATGLEDGAADVVLAAQAYHWFNPGPTLAEFHRILRRGGWVALLWNERDPSDQFTAAFGEAFQKYPGVRDVEEPRQLAYRSFRDSPLFENYERTLFHHYQVVDQQGLVGRAFSASYAPREPKLAAAFAEDLVGVFRQFQENGCVRLCYTTSLHLGQRREPVA